MDSQNPKYQAGLEVHVTGENAPQVVPNQQGLYAEHSNGGYSQVNNGTYTPSTAVPSPAPNWGSETVWGASAEKPYSRGCGGMQRTTRILVIFIVILVLIILGGGIGGGIAGSNAVQRAREECEVGSNAAAVSTDSSSDNSSSTSSDSSQATSSATDTATASTALPTEVSLDCPSLTGTTQSFEFKSTSWSFELTCDVDFSVSSDIAAVTTYSLVDCLRSCASYTRNNEDKSGDVCKGVVFWSEVEVSVKQNFGNCFLKNDTGDWGERNDGHPKVAALWVDED